MRVELPTQLHAYTGGARSVDAEGATLLEVVGWLDARYPGLKFRIVDEQDRIRPHIRFFVGESMARTLAHPVAEGEVVKIVGALSGG